MDTLLIIAFAAYIVDDLFLKGVLFVNKIKSAIHK